MLDTISLAKSLKTLVENGADPNARDLNGNTLLHLERNPQNVRFWLELEVDPNARNDLRDSPLLVEGAKGVYCNGEIYKILLESGADPNIVGSRGITPIYTFDEYGNDQCIKELLKAGAHQNKGLPLALKEDPRLKNYQQTYIEAYREGKIVRSKESEDRTNNISSTTVCEYITELSKIKNEQCGSRNVCIAEVSCGFSVGVDSDIQIERNFQAVCSSLSNGECPTANDCVMDRSMVEAETQAEAQAETPSPSTASPSSSTKATR